MKKRTSLVSSLIAIVICFSMLLGTTYAWFTDSIVNTNNIIKSGNVDVELYHKSNSDTNYSEVDGTTKLFVNQNGGDILWEVGSEATETFKIANAGSLSLKYDFRIKAVSKTVNANEKALTDVLTLSVKGGDNVDYSAKFGAGTSVGASLAPNDYDEYTVTIFFDPELTNVNYNDFQNLKLLLGIELVATQLNSEFDGTGNTFDETAQFPNVSSNANLEQGEEAILETKGENAVSAKLSANLVDELKNQGFDSVSLVHTDPIVENDKITFESIEIVDKDGNVIDLEELNLTEKITVTLPAQEVFGENEQVLVYHDGKEMGVGTVDANGAITYEVGHFCKVEVASYSEEMVVNNNVYEISKVSQLINLQQAVNNGNTFNGKTVVLKNDIDLSCIANWTPIGNSTHTFQGSFDGQGYTIKNLNCVMAGKSDVGLFGMTTNGEIKNLTVENAIITGRLNVGVVAGTPYTTKYTNVKVIGHVEVNGMSYVGTVGGKNAYANWTDVTVDVDETSYVKANSVENGKAYRTYVGGVIGFMGEGGHKFVNVNSNVDVIGSTCDVGGITGIAHYGNSFINCSSSGDVTVLTDDAIDAKEIGGIAGVWHNGGSTVTFENCTFTGNLYAPNCEVDLTENLIVGAPYSNDSNGMLIVNGEYVVTFASKNQAIPTAVKGKKVTLIGSTKGETIIEVKKVGTGGENCDYSLDGSTATFKNITLTTNSSTYIGYARLTATYENCKFNGTYTTYQNSVFNNCEFNVSGDVYNVWTWGAPEVTFSGCTFNSDGKAVLLYGTANTKLTVNNCTFNDNGGLTDLKAAIEIGNDYSKSYELIVNNTTVNGYEINDKGISTGTTLWANKNSMGTDKLNVVVDGVDVY